jgi:dihydrofolate reductase
MTVVSVIAAVAADGCIGRGGGLPWRLPGDLARFRAATMGKPVVMGRRTWESLPRRPLDGRLNIVVSATLGEAAGAVVARSLAEAIALAAAGGGPEVVVMGGAALYAEALPLAGRAYITDVAVTVPDGDTWFPPFDRAGWSVLSEERIDGPPEATFRVLARANP